MLSKLQVRVPATSANMGPGFDCLGASLCLYNTLTVEVLSEKGVSFQITGEGSDSLPTDETNLIYQTMKSFAELAGHPLPGLRLSLHNEIPSTRGLGSSATAIVLGLGAANEILDTHKTREELLQMATAIEGHPDNVAPAILGGVVIAAYPPGEDALLFKRFVFPDQVSAIVAIPSYEVSTDQSRAALPLQVPRVDAIYNVAQIGMMMASLALGDFAGFAKFANDRLHEPYRLPLMPGTLQAMHAARRAGANCVTLSGSGPTLLALYENKLGDPASDPSIAIVEAFRQSFANSGSEVQVRQIALDSKGLLVNRTQNLS